MKKSSEVKKPLKRKPARPRRTVDSARRQKAESELDRLRAELEEERRRWRATVESMPEAVTVCDAQGRATYMNPAYSRLVHRQIADDLVLNEHAEHYQLYRPDGTLFDSKDLPLQRAALNGETLTDVELIQREPSGEEHILLWNAAPIRSADGTITGAVAVGRDVTEQRRTAAALAETNRLLRAVLHSTNDAIYAKDLYGRYMITNPAAARLSGHAVEEILGRTDAELLPPELAAQFDEEDHAVLASGEALDFEYELVEEGTRRIYHTIKTPYRDDVGNIIGVVGVGRDITASRKIEEALRSSEERFRIALHGSSIGVFEMDQHLRYTWVYNPAPGFTAGNMLGKTDLQLLGLDAGTPMVELKREVLETGVPRHAEISFRLEDEERFFELFLEPRRDATGALVGITGAQVEITARKRDEQEREGLLQRERAAKAQAEQSAVRITRLQQVTANLSEALTPEQVARVIVEHVGNAVGAKSVSVVRLLEDGETLELYGSSGFGEGVLEAWRRFPLNARVPLADSIQRHEPIFFEDVESYIKHYPQRAENARELGYGAVTALPLTIEARTLGGIGLVFAEPRSFDARERADMMALAQQSAQALDRARLYAEERQARQEAEIARRRMAFLAEASSILSSSLNYETTLSNVADLAIRDLADWCVVQVLTGEGQLKSLAVRHKDPRMDEWALEYQQRFPADMNTPYGVARVIRTGMAELYSELPEELLTANIHSAEQLDMVRRLGLSSLLVVPLIARGRILGALTLISTDPTRHYDAEDLALAEELARRAAMAMDNSRLYAEAQAAIHIRDQFFTVASHELKTPLTSMMGYAEMLKRLYESGKLEDERQKRAVRTIFEQTRRLNRMITSLLDASRIETGQLSLQQEPMDLVVLVRRLIQDMQPGLSRHTFALTVPTEPLMVEGDELRLEQVIQNLLQNAVKYSPQGGTVRVQVERRQDQAVVRVADEGIGIPAEAIPSLFKRFYRAPNADRWRVTGMGIGLYVVREILTLHGGSIEVESVEGKGSTFTVLLPLLGK